MQNEELSEIKQQIHQFERIRNRKIILRNGALVTAYKPTKRGLAGALRALRGKASRMRRWER